MNLFLPRTLTIELEGENDMVKFAQLTVADHKGFALARGGYDLEVRASGGDVRIEAKRITIQIELALLTKEP